MATTSIGAPGVVFPDATTQATAGGSNVNAVTIGTSPGTWTKPASVKSIKVTVVGGGGNSGSYPSGTPTDSAGGGGGGAAIRFYPAPSLPGPQPYTVGASGGGTSSFGVAPVTVISATGGAAGGQGSPSTPTTAPSSAGGTGSNGNINIAGGAAEGFSPVFVNQSGPGGGKGGSSLLGQGGVFTNIPGPKGTDGTGYGGGGGGGRFTGSRPAPGSLGAAGVVIIEEFY